MEMKELVEGLVKLEKRAGRGIKYTDDEHALLFESFSFLSPEKWNTLTGKILMKGHYGLPPIEDFHKAYRAYADVLDIASVVHEKCTLCGSVGHRLALVKDQSGNINTAVAQCTCLNHKNWPAYPTPAQVEGHSSFRRWLGRGEVRLKAIDEEEKCETERRA